MRFLPWMCIIAFACLAAPVGAHPVPKNNHDRTIVVRLQKSAKPNHLAVRIEYRLEVDETTVLLDDMKPFWDEVDFTRYKNKPLGYYAEFTRIYAPIFADRLVARLNDRRLSLVCTKRSARLDDEETKQPLGHLRCDFVFEAEAPIAADRENAFLFREGNYQLQDGQILVGFVNQADVQVTSLEAPDEALQKRSPAEQKPGDDNRLREVKAFFIRHSDSDSPPPVKQLEAPPLEEKSPTPADESAPSIFNDEDSLLWLWTSDYSFWLKLLLATLFGAAHALTPGHGKTLVAAYLIGQRGTVGHAVVLGLVTTLTHTGAVLILAAVLLLLPEHLQSSFRQWILQGLGLAAGLMIVCLGVWLLLQRLSGRADHVHLGGGHEHTPGHEHSHSHGLDAAGATGVRWGGLIVLGITGGLVPCWDAIILLLYFASQGEFWMVLPAVVCFSAGLAGVLVLIGILVVQMPKFAKSRLGEGRLVHALPIVSAIVIVAMGFWLCYKGVQG